MLMSRPEEINLQEKFMLRSLPNVDDHELGAYTGFGVADDEELANTRNLLYQPMEMARRGTASPLSLLEPTSPGKLNVSSSVDNYSQRRLPSMNFEEDGDGGFLGN